MLLTPHTLVGLAIAKQVPNPFISAPLALLSHFIGDLIPHWDFFTNGHEPRTKKNIAIALDFSLGLSLGLVMMARAWPDGSAGSPFPWQSFNYGLCAFMACLPDGLEAPKVLLGRDWWVANKVLAWQHRFHNRAQLPWGAVPQVVLVVGALYILLV